MQQFRKPGTRHTCAKSTHPVDQIRSPASLAASDNGEQMELAQIEGSTILRESAGGAAGASYSAFAFELPFPREHVHGVPANELPFALPKSSGFPLSCCGVADTETTSTALPSVIGSFIDAT